MQAVPPHLFLLMKRNFAPRGPPTFRSRERSKFQRRLRRTQEPKNPPESSQKSHSSNFRHDYVYSKRRPCRVLKREGSKLLAEFRETTKQAVSALQAYETFLKTKLLPASKGDFRLGADTFRKVALRRDGRHPARPFARDRLR
jgi:hypothetical protein